MITKKEFYNKLVNEHKLKDSTYKKCRDCIYSVFQNFQKSQGSEGGIDLEFEEITSKFRETALQQNCDISLANLGLKEAGSKSDDKQLNINAIVDWAYTRGYGPDIMGFTKSAIEKAFLDKKKNEENIGIG